MLIAAIFLSALAFVISVFSFFFFKSYLRRRTGQERILSEFREEVATIVRTIDQTTDRDISLIEEREKNLKSLLEETDKRLRLYVRELEKRREADSALASLTAKPQTPTYQELGKNRYRLAAQDEPETEAAEPAPPEPPPIGEQIRELVRAGFTPALIASRLGLSIAEVEVVTALMARRDG